MMPCLRLLRVPVFLLLLLITAGRPALAQTDEVLDEIVAVVGEDILLRSDVDGLVLGLVQQRGLEYSDRLWLDALDQLIDQKVLAIHAQRDTTLIVTDSEVEQALSERIDQITQQVGSAAEVERIYGKSLIQIREDLRNDFRERLLAERFQGRKLRDIQVTPSEVRQWFNRIPTDSLPTLPEIVRLAHVVRYPKVSAAAQRQAREIITALRDSIVVGGQPLEELARRFSDDPGSAANGGRYDDMRLKDLVPEFAAVASRLAPGELSDPFETQFGYHVLRVHERQGETVDFSHILIAVDQTQNDPTEAIDFLEALRDSIVTQGVPFELIARRHSEEDFSAPTGGRVLDPQSGRRDLFLEVLGPSWQATLDTLDVGEISYPARVELLDGSQAYHIVLLQRRVPPHRIDLETDYVRLEELALQDKRQRVLGTWLEQLREEVYIDLRGKAERLAERLADRSDATLSQRRN